jgi:hypothetical protein
MTTTPNTANQAMTHLLPCPFCKGPAQLVDPSPYDYLKRAQVECSHCRIGTFFADADVCIHQWNRRPDAAQPSQAQAAEAVAWRYEVRGAIYLERCQLDHYYRDYSGEYVKGTPLYTTPPASPVASNEREGLTDTARLDFMLANDAFTVRCNRDGSIMQCQLMTQDEDENYHVLHDELRFYNTERDAIDAALLSARTGASHD